MSTALALGTYRCRDAAASAALAVATGTQWIDTAPNYGNGAVQPTLAPILTAHPEVGVSTKVGFLTDQTAQDALDQGVLTPWDTVHDHSLDPRYIEWQVRRSRSELGRTCLDTVFVHNPERACGEDRNELHRALRRAFAALEHQAALGNIDGYGVATWSGFADGVFTVDELIRLAFQASGGCIPRLTSIQLPVSLVNLAPLQAALAGEGPITDAHRAGLEVLASAPLHGGELDNLATDELAAYIRPGLSRAAACLHTVASCPGVTRVLLSASTPAHWHEAVHAVGLAPLDTTHLREITDVLATS
ncbi:aldo/keto reductase [Yinghuangia sp. ASG 101]|uniref:aldo/keto reductase n=1 Tax=Yinghuangia sp. ASG 101 TaxID=2896848 RepID=UPI001E4A889B|nr:aldo/keto reductase [Yinghuangia sp. ASG 101]UGQ14859.1 aldo/keto reductase [Yinghuangia sp. ASG 101]